MKTNLTRRGFLRTSSAAALGVGMTAGCATTDRPQLAQAHGPGKATPNEKIIMGVIGCGGRGMHDANIFRSNDDVEIAAVCDVYEPHRLRAMDAFEADGYHDFRELLERDDLDAVIVTTPPHWHPLITIMACEAGKDVYCEKPMCFHPGEGHAMVKAARGNNRVTQIGTQIHANENYHRAVEVVRSGVLGDISSVRTQLTLNEAPYGPLGKDATFGDPPDDLDWDMWCGPIPVQKYSEAMFVGGHHRYFEATIRSWLHEMGPHIVDLAFWAMELGEPKAVQAMGGRYAMKDIGTIPDTMEVTWEYDDFTVTWTNLCANSHGLTFQKPGDTNIGRRLGVSFHGVNGTLTADYGNQTLISEGDRLDESAIPEPWIPRSPGHDREFLNAIKSRELTSCDVEEHLPLAVALNLGNIAYKLGRRLEWDPETHRFINDDEANEHVIPDYRDPWKLPA